MARDIQARLDLAREHLERLLDLPNERPGAWEAPHVEALDNELRELLSILDGADNGDDGGMIGRVAYDPPRIEDGGAL